MLLGYPFSGARQTMKNFVRLVRFAWPYRVRFGLSLVCAVLVALLYGADIAAVYPLLKILFYNDNCQTWVAKEIVLQEVEVRKIDARLAEVDFTAELDEPAGPAARATTSPRSTSVATTEAGVPPAGTPGREPRAARPARQGGGPRPGAARRLPPRAPGRRGRARRAEALLRRPRATTPNAPPTTPAAGSSRRERAKADALARALPLAPAAGSTATCRTRGFRRSCSCSRWSWSGVALKGVFLFLQEVLVADVMQLTLFDIRNHFYRRTMALDLSSFGDQGTSELISRFTNDMDSVGAGPQHALQQGDPRAAADRLVPGDRRSG